MKPKQDLIFETKYWKVFLAEDQTYLGRCVVVLKRPCEDLAEVQAEELLEFLEVVKKMENAFKKAFNATMFNWGCLMNNAYQNNPPDPQVHWHVRPRYNHVVEFEGEVFEDKEFGHHYARGTKRIVSDAIREKMIHALKTNL